MQGVSYRRAKDYFPPSLALLFLKVWWILSTETSSETEQVFARHKTIERIIMITYFQAVSRVRLSIHATLIPIAGAIALSACAPAQGENSTSERRYFNGVYAPVHDQQRLDRLYEEARNDSTYIDSIKEARSAFGDDVQGSLDAMTEDGQLINITDDGIKVIVDGADQMRSRMANSFAGGQTSAGIWVQEKSGGETWGIYKNMKVTYHYSTFVRDDGTDWTRPVIVVAEHKDGKRWREWRFFPEDR